jgi:hypothetical protein
MSNRPKYSEVRLSSTGWLFGFGLLSGIVVFPNVE